MDPKKSFAATEPASSIDVTLFDSDPPVGQHATVQTPSPDSRRRSNSSLRSESNLQVPSPCATREIPGEECALQRFIVWAAVKRNKSVRMAASERLKCPLLLCGERFDDHEEMLRHLTKCQHLKTGEYVCYDCMKIERYNDGKCRCCTGHPTRRRRIMNMARSFFSNIGNKTQKMPHSNFQEDITAPPPSYDSLVIDLEEQSERQQHQEQPRQQESQPRPQIELNGTEIHELDSRQMLPTAELDPVNYATQPVDFPTTPDRPHNATPGITVPSQTAKLPRHSEPLSQYSIQQLHQDMSMPPPNLMPTTSGGSRPSLALDTHIDRYRNVPRTKRLSPSSSLRSTKSSHNISPVTPWSATSNSSGAWTMGSSIGTAMTSPITPLSPNNLFPASQPEEMSTAVKPTAPCPEDTCNYMVNGMFELPGDDLLSIPRGLSDPMLFSFEPKDNYSWMQSVDTEISLSPSVNMMFAGSNPKPTNIPSEFLDPSDRSPETRTLVETAWVALQEHISSSRHKLSHIEGNPLVERLQTQSPKTVALNGLSSLRRMLQGDNIIDAFDYLCFIHLIYAFSLVIHENDLATRCSALYQQALSYRHFLEPNYRDYYTQIVIEIWQPMLEEQSQVFRAARTDVSSSSKGKEPEYRTSSRVNFEIDPLVAVGQNFLDDLDNSVMTGGPPRSDEVFTSHLYSTHVAATQPNSLDDSPFAITASYIVQDLTTGFQHSDMLLTRLGEIKRKIRSGEITYVRKLELAILQAGKTSLDSPSLFNDYIPQVRRFCDPIYPEQRSPSRTLYQTMGISLMEDIIQKITSDTQHMQENPPEFTLELSEPGYNPFLDAFNFESNTGIDGNFFINLGTSSSQQNQTVLPGTPSFNPELGPMDLQDMNTSVPPPTITTAAFAKTASHTSTPDNSFTSPPGLPHPINVPTRPKPLSPAHIESPKSISSSAQKMEANDACDVCGYRPKGDPQWFKGSMAKHKKMQHSAGPPVIYKCPYPGCTSQYKNRQDNLRQHQIDKNHFVGDEAGRRPSKRKKYSPEE
ncbi:uncharacterized protein F4812DRAFT_272571 [Daldinia caldariorum]|uniref:uncharacterized protein n=1 Tax=Daldinia caldariorum TaxID=326644 RepID=UPI002008ACAF|nr:uncharacterized protein F4812DRAFT_272571 [Daldinia caldariorum]KAI1470622.1 hypothetical protein F4812DRAFT_272571 [Daldinia caldariorum]